MCDCSGTVQQFTDEEAKVLRDLVIKILAKESK